MVVERSSPVVERSGSPVVERSRNHRSPCSSTCILSRQGHKVGKKQYRKSYPSPVGTKLTTEVNRKDLNPFAIL